MARLNQIGIDIVRLERVRRLLCGQGHLAASELFGPADLADIPGGENVFDRNGFERDRHMLALLARKLAAKEAVIKVLGLAAQTDFAWRDIGIAGHERFAVELSPELTARARNRSISRLIGCVSSDRHLAIAAAIGIEDE